MKEEFEEKFVEKIRNGNEYDGDYLTNDAEIVWTWIEQQIKQARIDECKYWIKFLDPDMNDTIYITTLTNRIKELEGVEK
jgi:DNA transposition AAA+ family ATPase